MTPFNIKTKHNEDGYAVMVVLLVLAVLTLIGLAATTTSTIEVQIAGNTKKIAEDFYNAEGAMISAIEDTDIWLSDDFLNDAIDVASWSDNYDFNGDDDDALVEIRCIHDVLDGSLIPVPITGFTTMANDLPVDKHIDSPPPGKWASSAVEFDVRKYGVTSTALRNGEREGAPLQTGVWKTLPKTQN